jgi:hypothetical protein
VGIILHVHGRHHVLARVKIFFRKVGLRRSLHDGPAPFDGRWLHGKAGFGGSLDNRLVEFFLNKVVDVLLFLVLAETKHLQKLLPF